MLRLQELKLEARSAECGCGALGEGCYWAWERCKLPQWSPPAAKGFDACCVQMTSPAIESPVCTVQVWPHSGAPGSLNRLNPRVLRHWISPARTNSLLHTVVE